MFHFLVNFFRIAVEGFLVQVAMDDEQLQVDDSGENSSGISTNKCLSTSLHLKLSEAKVELRSHMGEDSIRRMAVEVSVRAGERGDMLFARAGNREFVDLVRTCGASSLEVDLPWPPPMMTNEDRKRMNGFGYLSRPPILPSVVTLSWGEISIWIDEVVAHSLLTLLGPTVLSPTRSKGEQSQQEEPSSELLKEFMSSFRVVRRDSNVQNLLLATQWTRFVIMGKKIEGCIVREGLGPGLQLGLEDLKVTTSYTEVNKDELKTVADVSLGFCSVKAAGSALPLGVRNCQASSTIVVVYTDAVLASDSMMPDLHIFYQLDNNVQLEAIHVSWSEDDTDVLASLVHVGQALMASVVAMTTSPDESTPPLELTALSEVSKVNWTLKLSLPSLSAAYTSKPEAVETHRLRYGACCSTQELTLQVKHVALQEGENRAGDPVVVLSCGKAAVGFTLGVEEEEGAGGSQYYDFPFLQLEAVEVATGDTLSSTIAEVSVSSVNVVWTPVSFYSAAVLIRPLVVLAGKHRKRGGLSRLLSFYESRPPSPPPSPPPVKQALHLLTSDFVTSVFNGDLFRQFPVRCLFANVNVEFPFCLGFDLGNMFPADVLRWANKRMDRSSSEAGWRIEVVTVQEASFSIRPSPVKDEWCFTIKDAKILHRQADGPDSPYCWVDRFATTQDDKVGRLGGEES